MGTPLVLDMQHHIRRDLFFTRCGASRPSFMLGVVVFSSAVMVARLYSIELKSDEKPRIPPQMIVARGNLSQKPDG